MTTDRIRVSGYRFPFPAQGYMARETGVYRFVPCDWSAALRAARSPDGAGYLQAANVTRSIVLDPSWLSPAQGKFKRHSGVE